MSENETPPKASPYSEDEMREAAERFAELVAQALVWRAFIFVIGASVGVAIGHLVGLRIPLIGL